MKKIKNNIIFIIIFLILLLILFIWRTFKIRESINSPPFMNISINNVSKKITNPNPNGNFIAYIKDKTTKPSTNPNVYDLSLNNENTLPFSVIDASGFIYLTIQLTNAESKKKDNTENKPVDNTPKPVVPAPVSPEKIDYSNSNVSVSDLFKKSNVTGTPINNAYSNTTPTAVKPNDSITSTVTTQTTTTNNTSNNRHYADVFPENCEIHIYIQPKSDEIYTIGDYRNVSNNNGRVIINGSNFNISNYGNIYDSVSSSNQLGTVKVYLTEPYHFAIFLNKQLNLNTINITFSYYYP